MIRNLVFDVGGVLQFLETKKRCDVLGQKYGIPSKKIEEAIMAFVPDWDRGLLTPRGICQKNQRVRRRLP